METEQRERRFERTSPPEEDPVPPIVRRLERGRERHRQRPRPVRALWVLAGVIVFLAGVGMLVTPGPAFVLIPIGLAMLAREFDWAQRALERSVVYARRASDRARDTSGTQKALTGLAVGALAVGFVVWAYAGDVPVLPV